MKIFNGKKIAEEILTDLKKRIKKGSVKLKLAVISVGQDPASKLFIRNKKQAAEELGIKVLYYKLTTTVKEEAIISRIEKLNQDNSVNGIIVQLPLPKKFNTEKILEKVSPMKDIDGFHKKTCFSSPLISAVIISLRKAVRNFKNKKIVALVNSDIFGRTLKSFLAKEKIKINYLKNRKSSKIKSFDIIITVLGSPGLIKGEMIKDGVVLIDGGITVINKKVLGDVDRKSVEQKASFLTPVPGGIGPLTVALLLKNLYGSRNK